MLRPIAGSPETSSWFAPVALVKVSIKKADGTMLESGDAVQQANGLDWTYTATASSSTAGLIVSATAKDLPGNATTLDITL